MTIAELIEALQKLPPDAVVLRGDSEWGPLHVKALECETVHEVHDSYIYTCWAAGVVNEDDRRNSCSHCEDEVNRAEVVVLR